YSLRQSRWRKWAYLTLWGRLVQRACTAWHFTSENEAAESWPWDDSPRFVVPNGIDPEDYAVDRGAAREDVWRALPELNRARYVLFLGRLHRKKRLDFLVEAFLASAPESVKLVVAGPDEGRVWQTLAKRIIASGRACRVVRVAGVVNGRDKIQLLAGASL